MSTEDTNIEKTDTENTDEEQTSEENTNTGEISNDVKDDIMKVFENTDCAYPLEDVMAELKELDHPSPGAIIVCAIQDNLIYVDSIEDNGTVYLAVVDKNEEE